MIRLFFQGCASLLFALSLLIGTTSAARADQRDFTLMNLTGEVITHVYVSPSNIVDWGEDILGRSVLDDEDEVFIYFGRFDPGSCLYDIKVVTESSREGVLTQVNLCEVPGVTFR